MRPVSVPPAGNLAASWPPGRPIPVPLRLHQVTVQQEWVDDNGHLSERGYLPAYRAMLDSQDAWEGAQAFAERRKPVWHGR